MPIHVEVTEWDVEVRGTPSDLRDLANEIRAGRSVQEIAITITSSPVKVSVRNGSVGIEGSLVNLAVLAETCEGVAAEGDAKAADPLSSPVLRHAHIEPIPGGPDTWLAATSYPLQITADA